MDGKTVVNVSRYIYSIEVSFISGMVMHLSPGIDSASNVIGSYSSKAERKREKEKGEEKSYGSKTTTTTTISEVAFANI